MAETSLKDDERAIAAAATAPAAAAASAMPAGSANPGPVSDWSPLRNPVFRAMWIASAVSYIGYEIRNFAAPLLMGDFRKIFGLSEGMISYTFTASTLPIPILVLFAGALADRVDRRKLLIVTHLWMMLVAGVLGVLTICHLMTPWLMLAFLFAIGAGYAMMNPALLAVIPELVEPRELKSALALNSVNMNIARVLGPAIGGLIIVAIVGKDHFYAGKGIAFLATALSLVGVVWVLARWKPAERKVVAHPETITGAVWTGVRYTFFTPRLLAIMARIFLFMVFAGILPVFCAGICKRPENLTALRGETGASIMMAFYGVGAIIGVYLMQALQRKFGAEEIVTVCTVLYGAAMLGVAKTPNISLGCVAMFVAGFNWVIVPTNFNIATQTAVPGWIKGRTMGMYVLVLWGSMSLGSAIFGALATAVGMRWSLFTAGIGVIVGSVAIFWLRLVPKTVDDFTPAKKGEPPINTDGTLDESRPVRVEFDYPVAAANHAVFRQLSHELRLQRLRNGAVWWELTGGSSGLPFTEAFAFTNWRSRARFPDRTTKVDAALLDQIMALRTSAAPLEPRQTNCTLPPTRFSKASLLDGFDYCIDRMTGETDRLFDRLAIARERDTLHRKPGHGPLETRTMLIEIPMIVGKK